MKTPFYRHTCLALRHGSAIQILAGTDSLKSSYHRMPYLFKALLPELVAGENRETVSQLRKKLHGMSDPSSTTAAAEEDPTASDPVGVLFGLFHRGSDLLNPVQNTLKQCSVKGW